MFHGLKPMKHTLGKVANSSWKFLQKADRSFGNVSKGIINGLNSANKTIDTIQKYGTMGANAVSTALPQLAPIIQPSVILANKGVDKLQNMIAKAHGIAGGAVQAHENMHNNLEKKPINA
jgi:hypothetical protein